MDTTKKWALNGPQLFQKSSCEFVYPFFSGFLKAFLVSFVLHISIFEFFSMNMEYK
jgi:hypothetical protein